MHVGGLATGPETASNCLPLLTGLQLPVPVSSRFTRAHCACLDFSSTPGLVQGTRKKNVDKSRIYPRAQLGDGAAPGEGKGGTSGGNFEAWSGRFQVALRHGAAKYYEQLLKDLKSEAGIDVENLKEVALARYKSLKERQERIVRTASPKVKEGLKVVRDEGVEAVNDVRFRLWPRIVDWNRWERWKNVKQWDAQRVGAFVLYLLLIVGSFRGLYMAAITPRLSKRTIEQMAETYLDATIPEPTPENVRKLRKLQWRENKPEGLRVRKEVLGPDGKYHQDPTFVGENAWEEDDEVPQEITKGSSQQVGENEGNKKLPWRQRLAKLNKLLAEEDSKEYRDALRSKYVIMFDSEELKKNILKEKQDRKPPSKYGRAFWVARRWWKYRPKLPYLYFLEKVENLEVEGAVYSPDRTSLFVTMKEGFPSEYVVEIPADPYLHDTLLKCGVEVDVMPESRLLSVLRSYAILLPCLYIFFILEKSLYNTRQNASEKIIDLIKTKSANLIMPWQAEAAGFPSFNDVIVDPEVWSVVEEIGNYMSDPMKYYNRQVFLPRGILIHGPPGTGKTHLARAMARQMKLPFIFASGSEFGESEVPGPEKIFDLFFTARANAPAIVFIDEIDALAGNHVEEDPKRLDTFKQLLQELDGGPIDTEVYRFSRRQAIIMICATNRRDDLHIGFLQPGRIDRELHIGLPKEKERVRIFGVHSAPYNLAEDVDFTKVVYRTRGYSGADLKNFVNEIAVNAKQRGSAEICQRDLLDVLEKQLFEGIGMAVTGEAQKQSELKVAPEIKKLLAVHEAGHILLAHLFPRFDWHAFSHLLPGGKESALSVFYPSEEMLESGGTIGYLKMQMVVAHGGRCSEELLLGKDTTDGWRDDLMKISTLAREIAVHSSNPRIGLLGIVQKPMTPPPKRPQPEELIPKTWDHPNSYLIPMRPEISELVQREIAWYIDETEKQAMEGLTKNRHILEKLANELERRIKMTGDEVKELIEPMNPVMLPDLLWQPRFEFLAEQPPEVVREILRGPYEDLDVFPAPLHRC